MKEVFESALKLNFSDKFDVERAPNKGRSQKFVKSNDGVSPVGGRASNGKFNRSTNKKDPSAVGWGPIGKGRGHLYRVADRCFTCGQTGSASLEQG